MLRLLWLVLLVLLGCSRLEPPSLWRSNVSELGVRMGWEVKVWNPTKTTLKATYTPTSTGGIVDYFRWEVGADGDCKRLVFRAVPATVGIAAQDIVQLRVQDGATWHNAFYGFVENPHSAIDDTDEEYVVLGMKKLIAYATPNPRRYTVTDLSALITATGTSNVDPGGYYGDLPQGVAYNAANISTGLGGVAWSYKLTHLNDILDKLAGLANVKITWGVDALGEFFFRIPAGSYSVGYAAGEYVPENSNASDIVTRAELIVSSENPAIVTTRGKPRNINFKTLNTSTPGYTDFLGNPITYVKTDALHSTYFRSRFEQIGYVDAADKSGSFSATTNLTFSNFSNIFDNDLATYAHNSTAASTYIEAVYNDATLGLEIEYSTVNNSALFIKIRQAIYRNPNILILALDAEFPPTAGHDTRNRVRIFCKYDGGDTVQKTVSVIDFSSSGSVAIDDFRVYDLKWLSLSPRLDDLAESFIKLPAPHVAEFLQNGFVQPVKTVTISSIPTLGTTAFDAANFGYELDAGNDLRTKIQLGERVVSESTRAIQNSMKTLDTSSSADARAYTDTR
jgi:hypothetical protein